MREATAYYRVSTQSQDIQSQREKVHEFAAKNDYQIVKEFTDDGISGANPDRPALLDLYKWIDCNSGKTLLLSSVDRAGRELSILVDLKKKCDFNSVDFYPINCPKTGNPALDTLTLTLLAGIAEYEKTIINERMMRGKLYKLKHGNPIVSRAPYGYLYVKTSKDKSAEIKINPDEAEVVKTIFDLYVNKHYSINKIAIYLSVKKKITTQTGNSNWKRSTIRQILIRSCYATGILPYCRFEHRHNGKRSVIIGERKKEEQILIKVPAFIDKQSIDKAALLLQQNKHKDPKNVKYPYLLSSLLKCSVCGKGYQGYTNKYNMKSYYRCSNRDLFNEKGKSVICKGRLVTALHIEPKIWEAVKEIATNPNMFKKDYIKIINGITVTLNRLNERKEYIAKKLSIQDRRRSEFMSAYNAGVVGIDDLLVYRKTYEDSKNNLQTELMEIQEKINKIDPSPDLNRIVFERENMKSDMPFERKREIVRKYIKSITVLPERHKYRVEFVIPYKPLNIEVHPFKHSTRVVRDIYNPPNYFHMFLIKDANLYHNRFHFL